MARHLWSDSIMEFGLRTFAMGTTRPLRIRCSARPNDDDGQRSRETYQRMRNVMKSVVVVGRGPGGECEVTSLLEVSITLRYSSVFVLSHNYGFSWCQSTDTLFLYFSLYFIQSPILYQKYYWVKLDLKRIHEWTLRSWDLGPNWVWQHVASLKTTYRGWSGVARVDSTCRRWASVVSIENTCRRLLGVASVEYTCQRL